MPRLRPQAKGTEGDIISAEGGLLGSGFVSKVGSFLASAEGLKALAAKRKTKSQAIMLEAVRAYLDKA